jgi:hypothetical protein
LHCQQQPVPHGHQTTAASRTDDSSSKVNTNNSGNDRKLTATSVFARLADRSHYQKSVESTKPETAAVASAAATGRISTTSSKEQKKQPSATSGARTTNRMLK